MGVVSMAKRPRKVLLRGGGPAEAYGNRGLIKFALSGINWTAIVETEYLVAEVQARGHELQPFVYPIAALNVVLRVGVEVIISGRPFQSQDRIIGRGVRLEIIGGYVGVIMAHGKAHGETRFVISKAYIPGIRRLALQGRVIGAATRESSWKGDL